MSTPTSSSSSSSTVVPATLLHSFFTEATSELNALNYNQEEAIDITQDATTTTMPVEHHQKSLLQVQQRVLQRIVSNFDGVHIDQVMTVLQEMGDVDTHQSSSITDTSLQEPMNDMTAAARTALARLVLQQALAEEGGVGGGGGSENNTSSRLTTTTTTTRTTTREKTELDLNRSDILDFCGLCQAVVLLPEVLEYLVAPQQQPNKHLLLYSHIIAKRMPFPHERLEYIQHAFYRALGYQSVISSPQLEKFMKANEQDDELQRIFKETIGKLRIIITNAALHIQQTQLTDFEEGGVTRVISVSYSESVKDGISSTTAAPQTESMRLDERESVQEQQQQMQMARQAAALEQSLLAQLLQMNATEREVQLAQAQEVQRNLMQQLAALPPGPERVQCMTTLPKEEQQLLLLYKLWQGLLNRNGGKPPVMAVN
jgi:hypothetical protein